jgi:transcriptional regulator with XRE-family HTH domain
MTTKSRRRRDALDYTIEHFGDDTPEFRAEMAEDHANMDVSMMVYALRTAAGLTQAGLAKRVGTTASAICRLEDAEYRGHSMAMLRRIAEALGMKVVVRFLPAEANARPGWILDKTQKQAIRRTMVADRVAEPSGPGCRPRRPPRARVDSRRKR